MSDMKNRYRGLILYFIMLVVLTGCVEQIQKPEPVKLFNREYYAVKNLTRSDIRKLKEMADDTMDVGNAKAAKLILGRHYVRNGFNEEGYNLIKEGLDDSYLDRFMKVSGHIWLYDAAMKMDDMETVEKEKEYIQHLDLDSTAEKVLSHYCSQEQKGSTGDVRECALREKPAGETEVEIEVFDQPKKIINDEIDTTLMEKVVAKVTDSEADPKLMEAMLYSISKLGVDFELDVTGTKDDYDFTLDAATKIMTSKTNLYEFGLDMNKVFEEAVSLTMLNGGNNIVIGYTEELIEKAMEIKDRYKDNEDINIILFDVNDENFQSTLRTAREQIGEDASFSFAVAGSQEQLVKVVPFLKFYSDKPEKTVITCALDGFGKLFFNAEYAEYFKGVYVVSEVLLLGKTNVEQFIDDYFNDYGALPTVKDMLGYDLIVFMERQKNPSFLNDYLTGIKSLEEGRTVRDLEAYKIVNERKIMKLVN